MLTEEFSFPKVTRSESIKNLSGTQSLWRITSGVDNLEDDGKKDRMEHKSFSEVEEMMRTGKYDIDPEEKMDMLWEDFNTSEFHEEEDCPSLIKSSFLLIPTDSDIDDLSSIAASRHYDRQSVMSYNMDGTKDEFEFDNMSMVHARSEMGDLEYLKDQVPRKYCTSLSLKKQNFAMVLKVLKKLRSLQKITRIKRRPSLSIT